MTTINSNISALVANNAIKQNDRAMSSAIEKLATGSRISSARDDAAGLSISARMASKISGFNAGVRNLNDGISMIKAIEGSYREASSIVIRMRELAVQAATGTLASTDRNNLDLEYQALKNELQNISANTAWNGKTLLDGSAVTQTIKLHDSQASKSVVFNSMYANPATSNVASASATSFYTGFPPTNYYPAEVTVTFSQRMTAGDVISFNVDDRFVALTLEDHPGLVRSSLAGTWNEPSSEADKMYDGIHKHDGSGNLSWNFTGSYEEANKLEATRYEYGHDKTSITTNSGELELKTRGSNQLLITGADQSAAGFTINVSDITVSRGDLKYLAITRVSSISHANTAIVQLDDAFNTLTKSFTSVGADLSALNYHANNLINSNSALKSSLSLIADTDYALETTKLARAQIISQASTAMLAQANQSKQTVLALLH